VGGRGEYPFLQWREEEGVRSSSRRDVHGSLVLVGSGGLGNLGGRPQRIRPVRFINCGCENEKIYCKVGFGAEGRIFLRLVFELGVIIEFCCTEQLASCPEVGLLPRHVKKTHVAWVRVLLSTRLKEGHFKRKSGKSVDPTETNLNPPGRIFLLVDNKRRDSIIGVLRSSRQCSFETTCEDSQETH